MDTSLYLDGRYGAWGDATAGGKTLQMRALDWDTSGPFQDYPQVQERVEREGRERG